MLRLTVALTLFLAALPLHAQDLPPSRLAEVELERSATCVDVLTRLEALDVQLQPLAGRAQRLIALANAIDIEEPAIADSLDASDPVEAAALDWFRADAELAQRYLVEQRQALLDERAAGRRAIQELVSEAIGEVQAQADSIVAPTGTLREDGVACSGVILVRSAAVEACGTTESRVCQAARDSAAQSPFRFVESPDLLWDRQEFRPWTPPSPIGISATGQLAGAQTIGNTRVGNVVVSVSFSPVLRARAELTAENLAALDSIDAALGIESTHPDVTFAPALGIQATLPRALGEETEYVLHFGPPSEPDVLWVGQANTGGPLLGSVALAPPHVARLANGDALMLTALSRTDSGEPEGVFNIELTSVNQVQPVRGLLAYMAQQLSSDLTRLLPPADSDTTGAPGAG